MIKRYLTVYSALWKNSVTREMIFKSNFVLWILVELLWFGLQLSFIGVLYFHTEKIGSWTKWQVVLLIGASHFIQQLFQAFFLTNCAQISEYIRTGKLDAGPAKKGIDVYEAEEAEGKVRLKVPD